MQNDTGEQGRLDRRAFIKSGSLLLATTAAADPSRLFADDRQPEPSLKIGLVTDLHYADKAPAGSRHYRETLQKLEEAGERLRSQQPSFVVELGDFVDAADSVETELGYLKRINRDFAAICKDRHYVLGNHCVHTLTKDEFLGGVERERSYYAFDAGGFHFIVLDSCFRSDGEPYGRKNFEWTDPNVPAEEMEWLQADLDATAKQTIVFAHQRLDASNFYGVKNAPAVRKVLEDSGRVLAVLQGHSHKNAYKDIAGIHYCTLVAMIEGSGAENNGYSVLTIEHDGTMRIKGFRKQANYDWRA